MPIEKFRTFEAARRALWCFEPDAEYYRKVADHFNLGRKLCPRNCPKGVFKYRSVSEADRNSLYGIGDALSYFSY
ncbi:MAG: hypothetical protein KJ573_09990 [Proteobacteria bacterium]|nr:hypothetical protein [Desulfobacterales bacterium]MBU0733830.1 hypothetical protein [Pseudomonadota bacterium]MBU1903906.1 hypothetical protein [Pseudomonadota bacterium]